MVEAQAKVEAKAQPEGQSITGTAYVDKLTGGDDTILGEAGNDKLYGGEDKIDLSAFAGVSFDDLTITSSGTIGTKVDDGGAASFFLWPVPVECRGGRPGCLGLHLPGYNRRRPVGGAAVPAGFPPCADCCEVTVR